MCVILRLEVIFDVLLSRENDADVASLNVILVSVLRSAMMSLTLVLELSCLVF